MPARRITLIGSLFLALLAALFLSTSGESSESPIQDPYQGVFDASLVVITSHTKRTASMGTYSNSFRIEEVFFGDEKVGKSFALDQFDLLRYQFGDSFIVPFTPEQRILFFLKHNPDTGELAIADRGYAYFWVDEPGKVEELRKKAREVVEYRQKWDKTRTITDPVQRMDGLWPFVLEQKPGFLLGAYKEFEAMGSAAGDYIADHFSDITPRHRTVLLLRLNRFGGQKLHPLQIAHLKSQQRQYEVYLAQHDPGYEGLIDHWDDAPAEMKEFYGEIYYGLAGLAAYRDRNDLPYIRELALWATKYHFRQTADDAALHAFRLMPDRENLPVIMKIWEGLAPSAHISMAYHVLGVLREHKFPETVPLLAGFMVDTGLPIHTAYLQTAGVGEIRRFLTEIVGKDLGPNPQDWFDWYNDQTVKTTPK